MPALLDKEKSATTEERGKWSLHGEDGHSIAIAWMKTMEHVQNLIAVADRCAEVGKAIGTLLGPGEVGDDRGRALLDPAKLCGEKHLLVLAIL